VVRWVNPWGLGWASARPGRSAVVGEKDGVAVTPTGVGESVGESTSLLQRWLHGGSVGVGWSGFGERDRPAGFAGIPQGWLEAVRFCCVTRRQ